MISKPNIDNTSAVTGTRARFSLLGLLMLGFGLLLSIFQPALGAPGKDARIVAATTYSITSVKNYSVAPSEVDIVTMTISPAPAIGTTYYYQIAPSTTLTAYQIQASDIVNGNAVFTVSFTGSAPGTVTVNLKTDPNPAVAAVASLVMNFIAAPGPPSAATSYFTVTTNNSAADGQAQDVVEAVLYDQYGNPVDGPSDNATVTWTLPAGNTTANLVGVTNPGSPPSITINANSGGTASEPLTDVAAESVPLTATVTYKDPVTGNPVTIPLTDQIAAGPTFVQPQPSTTAGANYIVTVVSPNPADNSSKDEVQVYVVDQSGVPMTGVTVTWTVPGGLTQAAGTTTSTVNGVATLYLTTATPGSYQIQAQVNGVYLNDENNSANNYVTVVFYPPPLDNSSSYITPVITPMPVGGQDEVEIHLSSASGPLTGATVTLGPIPTDVTVVTPGPYVTDGSGNVFIYFTSTKVGLYDISATYTDPGPPNGTYQLHDETITTQPYSVIQFVAGPVSAANSYIVVTQDNATANNTATDIVTAYLYDQYGNPIYPSSNPTLNWAVSPNVPTIQTSTSTPGSNVYTVAYQSPTTGAYQVTLQVNGVTINDQSTPPNPYVTIHFVAGQPVTGDPGGPSDGGDPGGGSPVNGGTPPPTSGGGGSGGGSGGGTSGGGSGSDPGTNNGFTEIYVYSQYNDRLADGQQQDSVYVYVTDANKNPVPGVAVTFYIQQPGGTITSGEQWTAGQTSSPITVTTGPDGVARVAMTSTTPGSVWVYASIVVGGTPQLVAKSDVEVDFVTKPDVTNIQTALTVIVGEALADGTQQNEVKAHVVDLDGNVMANQQVYFAIDSGTGTIVTPQPVTTDANGDAYIQITSKTVGYVLITATVDSENIVFGSPARVYFAMINIYVPRAFSPNNDGVNDLLKPILVGISTFHYFNIYNRWGNLIFTTQDPNQGWDGTFKGVPQPVETYLWIAEGIDENGHKVVQKGMTSLVR